jgi:hypothetical protein
VDESKTASQNFTLNEEATWAAQLFRAGKICHSRPRHDFRRLATRYGKLAKTFFAAVHLVAAFLIARNSWNTAWYPE